MTASYSSWTQPGDETVTHYSIQRAGPEDLSPQGFTNLTSNTGASTQAYNDMSAEPDATYSYRVAAVGKAGQGPYSNPAKARTPVPLHNPDPVGHRPWRHHLYAWGRRHPGNHFPSGLPVHTNGDPEGHHTNTPQNPRRPDPNNPRPRLPARHLLRHLHSRGLSALPASLLHHATRHAPSYPNSHARPRPHAGD